MWIYQCLSEVISFTELQRKPSMFASENMNVVQMVELQRQEKPNGTSARQHILHSSQAGVSAFSTSVKLRNWNHMDFSDCQNSLFKNIWAYLTQAFSHCLVLCLVMGSSGSCSWSKPLTGSPALMAPCYHSFCIEDSFIFLVDIEEVIILARL